MGSSGFYHILMACNGLYQFIRGISWFYLVLPSFFFPKAELTFVSVLPVSFFDSDRRLFRDVCFLFVNNEENKQTNKQTNQPTNQQTNKPKRNRVVLPIKSGGTWRLGRRPTNRSASQKKKNQNKTQKCATLVCCFFFRFRSHRLRHFIGDMIRWAMDFSLRYLSLSLSLILLSFSFLSYFFFIFFIPRTVTRFDWIRSLESGSRLFFLLLVFIVATRIGSDRVLPSFT